MPSRERDTFALICRRLHIVCNYKYAQNGQNAFGELLLTFRNTNSLPWDWQLMSF